MTITIEGSTALVTGANRGLGAAFCRTLLERGAAKVYAGARDPSTVSTDGVIPIELDVTNAAHVQAAATLCTDVNLLVNNAGISGGPTLADDSLEVAAQVFATNVYGPLAMSKAFAAALAANGGGAIVNVLSVLAWFTMPGVGIYSASKAAGWQLTNALRLELQSQPGPAGSSRAAWSPRWAGRTAFLCARRWLGASSTTPPRSWPPAASPTWRSSRRMGRGDHG